MMKAVVIMLLTGLVLVGCGQKGPLFLPGEAPQSQTQGPFGLDTKNKADNNNSNAEPANDARSSDDNASDAGENHTP